MAETIDGFVGPPAAAIRSTTGMDYPVFLVGVFRFWISTGVTVAGEGRRREEIIDGSEAPDKTWVRAD